MIVQGFCEADTGTDETASVAPVGSVHEMIASDAKNSLAPEQVDIKTAFLHARIPPTVEPVYEVPPKRFECRDEQTKQVRRLKGWLYGLRLCLRDWWDALHVHLLGIGFIHCTTDPCLYILDNSGVLLLVYVDGIHIVRKQRGTGVDDH